MIIYHAFGFHLCSGYLAPEYALGGQLTKKADIYSFGVLILEIISGKSSSRTNWEGSHKFLLEWVHKSQFFILMSYFTTLYISYFLGLQVNIILIMKS